MLRRGAGGERVVGVGALGDLAARGVSRSILVQHHPRRGVVPLPIAPQPRARLVAAALVAASFACAPGQSPEPIVGLEPVAAVPLDAFGAQIALVSDDIACFPDRYEFTVMCYDRSGERLGVWGREGEGPGEFQSPITVRRWLDGQVAVFDIGAERMTLFEPTGRMISEARVPGWATSPGVYGNRVSYVDLGGRRLVELDVESGRVLWERVDYMTIGETETECGRKSMGVPTPQGGWVFPACRRELVFLEHRDDAAVTVVRAPNYVEEFPNRRDIEIMRSNLESTALQGAFGVPHPSRREQHIADYAARPKDWFMDSFSMKFDSDNRLWIGTQHDRSAFSYIDVWTGTEYSGSVRVRDRLVGFDILGPTLVTVVMRPPGRNGISKQAIDWYDIGGVEFGPGG